MPHSNDIHDLLAIACANAGWTTAAIVTGLEIPPEELDRRRRQNPAVGDALRGMPVARPRRRRKPTAPRPVTVSAPVPTLAKYLGVSEEATVRLLDSVEQQGRRHACS